jgi:hypothetical protein
MELELVVKDLHTPGPMHKLEYPGGQPSDFVIVPLRNLRPPDVCAILVGQSLAWFSPLGAAQGHWEKHEASDGVGACLSARRGGGIGWLHNGVCHDGKGDPT